MSNKVKKFTAALLTLAAIMLLTKNLSPNDLHNSSVMITNRAQNSGGTGIIMRSQSHRTEILTNAHVCKLVKDGGLVISTQGQYQVNSVKISEISDLCTLTVLDNLHVDTRVAMSGPSLYDSVSVSGHPSLYPNIISTGHVSGRAILPVMTEIRACTEDDLKGEEAIICLFLGGIPVIKYFESILTSATIMPGSSGSGVYNSHKNLIGVVFAGSKDFGYSWTVPYEQVRNFLDKESLSLTETPAKQEMNLLERPQLAKPNKDKDLVREAREKCISQKLTDQKIKDVCAVLSFDMIWRK